MSKIKHICATCKSDDVVLDAWAEWDIDTQDWVLRSVFDDAFCIKCEQACDMEEVEIEDEQISMDIVMPREVVLEDLPEPVRYAHKFIDGDEIGEPNPEVKRAIAELLSKKPK
jgi:hypothetical protein